MVTRKRLKSLITRYKKKLGLEDHHIDVLLSDKVDGAKDYYAEVTNKTFTDKSYTISFLKDSQDKDLPDTVMHELLHILLWAMSDIVDSIIAISGFSPEKKQEMLNDLEHREHEVIDRLIKVLK